MINFLAAAGIPADPVGELMGIPVYKSHWIPQFTSKRIRAHTRKHWDRTGSYHRRIDKKWLKRYGVKRERQVLKTPQGLFMHPGTWAALRQQMERDLRMRPDPVMMQTRVNTPVKDPRRAAALFMGGSDG